ncbi:sporulation protein [Clostridium sp. AM48-13]|nr:sporulation protein [Clostridium sp. AM48-13]
MADERDGKRGNMAAWRQCVYGIALMMMYDGLRIFRWLVRHSSFWTGMEDAAYWLFASFATFRLLFGQNDGVLRGYAVAGVLGGMVFYDRTGSVFCLRY